MSENQNSIFDTAKTLTPGASLVRESLLELGAGEGSSPEDFIENVSRLAEEMVPDEVSVAARTALIEAMVSASITSALSENLQSICRNNKGELRQSSVFAVTRFVAKSEMLLAQTGRMLNQVMGAASLQELGVGLEALKISSQEVREDGMSLLTCVLGREPQQFADKLAVDYPAKLLAFFEKFPASPKTDLICEYIGIN